jgi:hypothetical protein
MFGNGDRGRFRIHGYLFSLLRSDAAAQQRVHGSRFTVHSSQFTVRGSQFMVEENHPALYAL